MADPVTGLTQRDREVIANTWEEIGNKKVIKDYGVDLFIALFKAFPYMQDYFAQFKGQTLEDLKTSRGLRNHASGTMHALKGYVENLDDPDTLVKLVTRTANIHLPKGIKTVEMDKLAFAFDAFMKENLGEKWTEEASAAWAQLLKVHNAVYKQEENLNE
ncbi:globin [Plakobranchus ocellatus]|uniref:Globin n=1 Tax=Plakobranchus ocellatus TaxID=259542 RepID=A0AAV4C849_9GAST|nr:globin [Plakobranchus ocellatus]